MGLLSCWINLAIDPIFTHVELMDTPFGLMDMKISNQGCGEVLDLS